MGRKENEMPQGDVGKIKLFHDFFDATDLTNTGEETNIGPFRFFGQGTAELDSGVVSVATVSGVGRITTTDEAAHSAAVGTGQGLSPALNGTLVCEARVQLNNLDTKTVFVGFSDDAATTAISPATGSTTTLTLGDSDICGFVLDAALTSDEEWHFVHNGGASAGVTDSTALVSGIDAVAAEWDVLRIEIDTNGTARWYINEVLSKTLVGAVAPATVFAAYAMVQAAGAAIEQLDVDYLDVRGARDWTR
jgi:hypothetical protein